MSQATSLPEGAIVRRVRCQVGRSFADMFRDIEGRDKLIRHGVIATVSEAVIPHEVEVCFIPLRRGMAGKDVFQLVPFGYRMATAKEVAKVNEDDPDFSDHCPNFTLWGEDGRYSLAYTGVDNPAVLLSDYNIFWEKQSYLAVVREEQKQD